MYSPDMVPTLTYTNRESKCKGSKERQGPTLGVRFTEVLIF